MIFNKNAVHHLVYSATGEYEQAAINAARILSEECELQVVAVSDEKVYENEILFGNADRALVRNLSGNLCGIDGYVAGAWRSQYVILADERFGLAVGLSHLIDCLSREEGTVIELTAADHFYGRVRDLAHNAFYLRTVRLARTMFGTYGSWLQKQLPVMSQEDQVDIELVEDLVRRLGNGLVLSIGSSSALWRRYLTKTDRTDYSRVTKQDENGHILIADDLASRYLGTDPTPDGYVDLTAYVDADSSFTLSVYPGRRLVILLPEGCEGFADVEYFGIYADRMQAFFQNPVLPEPKLPVEQTRRELIYSQFGTAEHYDYTEVTYDNYYSPAILVSESADGTKVLYAAHEISRLKNHKETATVTCLKQSTDNGESWRTLAMVADMRWASLFEWKGCIYLMGNCSGSGCCMIAEWTPEKAQLRSASLGIASMGSAPCAVAMANGRIYRAYNGAVLSAPDNADLLDGSVWTVSNSPHDLLTRAEYERLTGTVTDPTKRFWLEEGNIVVGPDNTLYAMYRLDATPTWGYAAIFQLSADGTTLSVIESCNSVIPFPSNQSKFMIKRDPKTGLYLTFVSLPTAEFTHQRNVLGLAASADLLHWRTVETLLVDRQMMNTRQSIYAHAFQYVDFDFDGDDIILIVREAVGDTCVYHDGISVTLYTVSDYQKLL